MTIVRVLATFAVGMQLVLKQRIRFGMILSGSGEAWYVIISYGFVARCFDPMFMIFVAHCFSFFQDARIPSRILYFIAAPFEIGTGPTGPKALALIDGLQLWEFAALEK